MLRTSLGVLVSCAAAVVAIAACSSTSVVKVTGGGNDGGADSGAGADSGTNADAGGDGGFVPVPTPALEVIPNNGGPVIANPEIVTITWTQDTISSDLEAFDDWMVPSDFWKTLMAEWGVGPGTHLASYRIPDTAPATLDDTTIQTTLAGLVASGAIPPPTPSRIYTVYPPAGTVVMNFGEAGCDTFQAYHYYFDTTPPDAGAAVHMVYAVAPRCADTSGLSSTDFTTWGMSHEVMEASSDPIATSPTWVILNQTSATPEPGENADLCTGHPAKIENHEVTLNYSNVAAAKGERPCVPAPAGPMFGAYADPAEISVSPGATITVTLHAFSSAPMAAFKVSAYPSTADLTATLSKGTASNGDNVTLTITASATYQESPGANLVDIYSISSDYLTRLPVVVHQK